MSNPSYLKPTEVAQILKVTPQTVRSMCDRGELDHIRIGTGKRTTYRIQRRALDSLLHSRSVSQPTDELATVPAGPLAGDDDEYIQNWLKPGKGAGK